MGFSHSLGQKLTCDSDPDNYSYGEESSLIYWE
jgi:hypothetical protein